jgi:formate hydrogenlyase subunit 3/multisubunit Na+/H+ antiporter MnhD subunit
MTATLLAASLVALLLSAAVALVSSSRPRAASLVAVVGAILGSSLGVAAAVPVLLGAPDVVLALPLRFADEPIVLGIDPLSALFVVLVGLLGVPAALFGLGYLDDPGARRAAARAHAGVGLLLASLIVVATARDALVFLLGWEAMTLAAYFLVVFDHEDAEVRAAGFLYLVASHLAYACIFAFFAVLGHRAGSFGFDAIDAAGGRLSLGTSTALFALALLGFGTKAGVVPLHVWLPRAHPAAPSHVSALMSGVLIKTGVYALLRSLQFIGVPQVGFGITLVVVGGGTAVYGIAFSLGQRDIKRALAYSSIENVGLIVLGVGMAQMAAALGEPRLALLAAIGALVHLVHHVLMKGGLFLGAGAVVHATGTRDVERLGGLLRSMPRTATAFLACSAAISALPPFCGFVGEWLLLSAAVLGARCFTLAYSVPAVLAVLAVVVAGALAAASFARLFAVVFLGTPRSATAREAHAGGALVALPPLALAAICLASGLYPTAVVTLVERAAAVVAHTPRVGSVTADPAVAPLVYVGACGLSLVALLSGLALLRRRFGGAQAEGRVPTWGCGFVGRLPRAQYTASSFGRPLVQALSGILAPQAAVRTPDSAFASAPTVEVTVPDRVERRVVDPLVRVAVDRMAVVRRFQDGRITRYLVFVVVALVAGLGWAVAARWVLAP